MNFRTALVITPIAIALGVWLGLKVSTPRGQETVGNRGHETGGSRRTLAKESPAYTPLRREGGHTGNGRRDAHQEFVPGLWS